MTNLPRESSSPPSDDSPADDAESRRDFLAEGGAIAIGGLVGLVPVAAGAIAFTDPLFPKKYPANRPTGDQALLVLLTTLDNLPDGGPPQQFPVRMDKVDAWTFSPNEPVGAVYLARVGKEVSCLNAICPHAGCFVGYDAAQKKFVCPCHDSAFGLDGQRSEHSPSPRNLDALVVQVESSGEVKVKFQNFLTGKAEQVPR